MAERLDGAPKRRHHSPRANRPERVVAAQCWYCKRVQPLAAITADYPAYALLLQQGVVPYAPPLRCVDVASCEEWAHKMGYAQGSK